MLKWYKGRFPGDKIKTEIFMQKKRWNSKSSFQIITFGFAALILTGTLLLMLPFATRSGRSASFMDALFTATSASCVTGLIVHDTAAYWSSFGQAVILVLIQIGGMGIVTFALAIQIFSGRKIGLSERSVMSESISSPQLAGVVRLTRFILTFCAAVEAAGALLLMPVFIPKLGIGRGIWYSFFHSISAFCNAGFDLNGYISHYSSLTAYSADTLLNIVIMALIITGGIGFLCWHDILTCRQHIKKWRMQTKVVVSVTAVLIAVPAICFYLAEYKTGSTHDRVLLSFFQSVTTRTAGFNTADLTKLHGAGIMLMIVLMLIGGSPGSTAGGMKTTTFAVLSSSCLSVFLRKPDVNMFRRRIDDETQKKASALLMMYTFLPVAAAMIISTVDDVPIIKCLFETASALGTVGLTLGVTPGLSNVSHILLAFLMYMGRVGGLTLVFAAVADRVDSGVNPVEKITVG